MARDPEQDNSWIEPSAEGRFPTLSQLNDVAAVIRARWYLRTATEVGPRVRLWGRPVVRNQGTMIVGERARLVSTIATLELATEPGASLRIGARTYINYGCSIGATSEIRIGSRCNIGTHVIILDNDYHELDPDRRHIRPASAPTILEDNVWVGARAIILRGVTIGSDSVIGAGSVVTQDVPPRSLAAGQPARVIRSL